MEMNFFKIKGRKGSFIVDPPKALLLNEYLKDGYIKMISKVKTSLEIEILTDNPVVINSIIKA